MGTAGYVREVVAGAELAALAHASNEGFHVRQIPFECLTSGRREPVLGTWDPTVEAFLAGEIVGVFELSRVHRQVAVGGIEECFELVKREHVVHGECTHDGESHTLVNEAIERERRTVFAIHGA